MIDEIGYSIVLLRRVMRLLVVSHIENWVVHFIEMIKRRELSIDCATIISNKLDEQLILLKTDTQFYMTSYLIYLLVARPIHYLGLVKRQSIQDTNVWPYKM